MLTCMFLAGGLWISNGEIILPFDRIEYFRGEGSQGVAELKSGHSLLFKIPDGKSIEDALMDCHTEAEARLIQELEIKG